MAWLPARLPKSPPVAWRSSLPGRGLGGVAATSEYVIVSCRELMDTSDAWICFDAKTGKEIWKVLIPAPTDRELDYGNTPRATAVLTKKLAILSGAFGNVTAVDLATGKTVWEKDLRLEFDVKDERKWGLCSTPLLVGEKLILNPGGKDASLVAVEASTGKVLWKTPGKAASYGNFIAMTVAGKKQIIGFDAESLGGWDVENGKRLWKLRPTRRSDFNVPTPIPVGLQLLVPWENNGTYLFGFTKEGKIDPKPIAHYPQLSPDTHTPVVTANRVFGAWNGLHCLDLKKKLERLWLSRDSIFSKYVTLIACENRVLVVALTGELILLDAEANTYRVVDRRTILKEESGVFSHAAFVGTRMYLRGDSELLCVELKP